MKKSWLTKLVILIFLFSTFSNSLLVTQQAFAETGGDDGVNETIVYKDGEYDLPVEFLHETEDETSLMNNYVENKKAKIEIKNNKVKVFITFTDAEMIEHFKVEVDDVLQDVKTEEFDEEKDTRTVSFNIGNLNEVINGEVSVDVPGLYNTSHKVRIIFDTSEIPPDDTNIDESESEEDSSPEEDNKGDISEDSNDATDETDKDNEVENPDVGIEEDEKNEGNNENESEESTPEEDVFLKDGVYKFTYETEGVNLSSYYENEAIVIVKDGQQYLQLQGKSMHQFIEYLYMDGKRMDISAPMSGSGAYITQIPLNESIDKNNVFTFSMVINAMGRIMYHTGTIKLDLMSKEQLADDAYKLIKGVPTKENESFEDHKNVYSYEYDSGDMDLSRYYENTIDVLHKNGKTYLEFKGTGMSTFIEALYVDGKKMAIQENDDGSYIAQIEYEKELNEKFQFDMIINAMGRIMAHGTEVTLLVPSDAKTLTYTTKGANIAGSYEPEAFLLERNGEQYIQLQGKSMREYIEYLYIDGKKMDISGALNEKGAYIAQFKLDKPLDEKNTFKFDMVINARGMLMNHQTEITFDVDSIEDTDKIAHTIVSDTTTTNNTDINEHDDVPTVSYETVGADISKNYEDFISLVKSEGKQYLQLHGKSGHEYVDALFIDGERMIIGEPNKDGSYLAQYELSKSLEEKNTFDFTMLINTPQGLMTHSTKIIITHNGEYLIDFEALYENEDKTSTASNYLVNPTKLVIDGDKKQLFIKLKDHETITEFKVKQDDKYVSPEIVSINEKANTRIVAFDIKNLNDDIHAQVKVEIPGGYSSEQPFRIKLDNESLTEYDGSLEQDVEKPTELENGHYTINFRTLDAENFEKVEVGKLLNPPANIELKDGKRIVTLTIDDEVEKFEIKQGDKFVEPKVVNEDKENKTWDVQFEISDLDEIVIAKLTVISEKQRAATTEHDVRMYFEGNSLTPVEVEEDPAEKVELVADAASTVDYQILKDENDDESSANGFFSGKAVLLEHEGNKYAQITTQKEGAQFIDWLKNKVDGSFEDMVIVEEKDGERTYQFKLDGALTEAVALNMFIDAGMYAQEHNARLIFEPSTEKEADPKDYALMASTNANGPDGDNAQTPGDGETPDPEPEDPTNPKPNPTPDPVPTPDEVEVDAYTMEYKILNEQKDGVSVANNYFTGIATLIDHENATYVQIATKDKSGKFIQSLQNKLGKEFTEMLVVQNKNDDKIYQFKLGQLPGELVPLKMSINVPGVYKMDHDAFLQFDTGTLKESQTPGVLFKDKTGKQGPKNEGTDVPTTPIGGSGGKTEGPTPNPPKKVDTKNDIKPDKAFEIDYVIKQETSNEVSVADGFFTGKAILLEKGEATYAQISTKDGAAQFIDAFRSQLGGKFVDMAIVAKNGDDITYQFKLDGTEHDPVLLDMIITVPGVYENQAHKARLFFDPATKKEVDASKYTIVDQDGSLGKPSFGNGSNGSATVDKNGKETNPKTSDMTMIVFYTILLVIAGGVLVFQVRRNMAKQ